MKPFKSLAAFTISIGRAQLMKGVWFWPADAKGQARVLRNVLASEPMLAVLSALSKRKEGLSNAQIDVAMNSFSQWNARSIIDELLSLGFMQYRIEWFGDAGKYMLTDLGTEVLGRLSGQPQQPPAPHAPASKPAT